MNLTINSIFLANRNNHKNMELPWVLLALYRRTLCSERHGYEIAWPDKPVTDPMASGGFKQISGRRRGTRGESRK